MNIGEVSERAGLPAKTIRYYEDIGLVRPLRSDNGYRAFRDSDIHGRAKDRATLLPGEEPCPGGVAEDDANGAAEGDAAPARATGESRAERPARCRDACCPPCSVL